MDISYQLILIGALLGFISILATRFAARVGMPILLAFLLLGMLAGEQGPGQILFGNVRHAHLIGTLALAIILLDAGLHTKNSTIQASWLPALSLSIVGILLTSAITGLFAARFLQISWLEGLLLGVILAPTDAAAVFSTLRAGNIQLKSRVAATLELESGSNDPIAVLLTIAFIHLLQSDHTALGMNLLTVFLQEIVLGVTIAIIMGYAVIYLSNRIKLAPGLYPLLVCSSGLLIFAATNLLGGSGYLAVYLVGIIIGNSNIHQKVDTLAMHDGLAWLSQIGVFLMLGLLVMPSALLPHVGQALGISLVLILVARPLAVWLSLLPFKYSWQEQVFISWVGLRGAVPIILALNPLLADLNHAALYFNLTFFIVIVSIVLQGWTLPIVARWLKLEAN